MAEKKVDTPAARYGKVILFLFLIVFKALRVPPRVFRRERIRNIMEFWSIPMMWLFVTSGGKRIYCDMPCTFKMPADVKTKCEVAPEYRFTKAQMEQFYRDGFIGPLTAVSEEEMREIRDELVAEMSSESKAFGFKTVRDRHLDSPLMLSLFTRPVFTERLAQLLGPDLLIWRSQFFNQEPGAPPIHWHQASAYMVENYERPVLEPVEKNDLFQLTTWLAVDDAKLDNGCMQFARGTHDQIRTITLGGDPTFFGARYQMDFEPKPEQIVTMELKAGQFVIFSERCVHGSPGNRSNRRRLGLNFRTILPSTRVYRGQESYYAVTLKDTWKLDKWGVYVLRGEDKYHVNKVFAGHPASTTAQKPTTDAVGA